MDVIKLINDQLTNPDTLKKLEQTVGAQPEQVQKVAQLGLPAQSLLENFRFLMSGETKCDAFCS